MTYDRDLLNKQYEYIKTKTSSPVKLTRPGKFTIFCFTYNKIFEDMYNSSTHPGKIHEPVRKVLQFNNEHSQKQSPSLSHGLSPRGSTNNPTSTNYPTTTNPSMPIGIDKKSQVLPGPMPGQIYNPMERAPSTSNLLEDYLKQIERTFLLQQKAADEEEGEDSEKFPFSLSRKGRS